MRVIGLMSGTSMDGLDAAVAEIEWDGGAVAMSPLRHSERPWPDEVRARLHASLGPAGRALGEWLRRSSSFVCLCRCRR